MTGCSVRSCCLASRHPHVSHLCHRPLPLPPLRPPPPPPTAAFAGLRTPDALARVQEMPSFFDDLANGTLPRYSFIQPRMASSVTGPSNWQHPDNSVEAGEALLASVYAALRASPYWEQSALIITYDEHGGFRDHLPTPTEGVPSPDGVVSWNGFGFDRLGVRIPTVIVSPWVPRGTVVNLPSAEQAPTPTSQWEVSGRGWRRVGGGGATGGGREVLGRAPRVRPFQQCRAGSMC